MVGRDHSVSIKFFARMFYRKYHLPPTTDHTQLSSEIRIHLTAELNSNFCLDRSTKMKITLFWLYHPIWQIFFKHQKLKKIRSTIQKVCQYDCRRKHRIFFFPDQFYIRYHVVTQYNRQLIPKPKAVPKEYVEAKVYTISQRITTTINQLGKRQGKLRASCKSQNI